MAEPSSLRWMLFGAGGLVGSHMRIALEGRNVLATAHRTSVPGAVTVDLANAEATAQCVRQTRPDVVVMAAADANVERCEHHPSASRAINVDAVRNVARAAPNAVLVVFSSEYVFDGRAGSYAEEDAVAPINEYGRQKVDLEDLARGQPQHLICRVSGVYGWSRARTSSVAQLVDALRSGRRFRVPADQLITPTPAADLSRAVIELIDRGARGLFHVAGPEILPRPEFARRAAVAFDLDPALLDAVPTAGLGLAAPRPLRAGLRTEKLTRMLGHGLRPSAEALVAMRETEAA